MANQQKLYEVLSGLTKEATKEFQCISGLYISNEQYEELLSKQRENEIILD